MQSLRIRILWSIFYLKTRKDFVCILHRQLLWCTANVAIQQDMWKAMQPLQEILNVRETAPIRRLWRMRWRMRGARPLIRGPAGVSESIRFLIRKTRNTMQGWPSRKQMTQKQKNWKQNCRKIRQKRRVPGIHPKIRTNHYKILTLGRIHRKIRRIRREKARIYMRPEALGKDIWQN